MLYFTFRKCISKTLFLKNDNRILNRFLKCQDSDCKRFYGVLSPNEVTFTLRANEHSQEVNFGSVKSFDTNQVASNSPIEDSRAESKCLLTTGMLFGVFDGHGGTSCSQVVAKRLFNYISASLLPTNLMENLIQSNSPDFNLLENYNDEFEIVSDLQSLYRDSFLSYINSISAEHQSQEEYHFQMEQALKNAFNSLDSDISSETISSIEHDNQLSIKTLSVAISGAVACIAHIDSEHLHIASCGDCRAVLGVREGETWVAKPLTKDHNTDNNTEVARILSEHPEIEKDTIFAQERLLGQLAPLRAFGDVRFKWGNDMITKFIVPYFGKSSIVPQSLTPPYLTAEPEISYHKLRAKDAFLILATDGLWDFLSSSQAVKLVGEHMFGKTILSPFKLPDKKNKEITTLGEIYSKLHKRKESQKLKPIDENAATHLIRNALGGSDQGFDHLKISQILSIPEHSSRHYRDDISVTVVFFDSDYLSLRPL